MPLQPQALAYVEACEKLLWQPVGRPVLEYLLGRGLEEDVLRLNRVGADPGTGRLRRAGGLPKHGVGAVFPALDVDGQVTYFQTRYLDPKPNRSKYANPAARLGDNPHHGWTRPPGPAKQPIVMCEGFPDAYIASSAGYDAIAILGTANANERLVERLRRTLQGTSGRPHARRRRGRPTRRRTALTDRCRSVASWWSTSPFRPERISTAGCTKPAAFRTSVDLDPRRSLGPTRLPPWPCRLHEGGNHVAAHLGPLARVRRRAAATIRPSSCIAIPARIERNHLDRAPRVVLAAADAYRDAHPDHGVVFLASVTRWLAERHDLTWLELRVDLDEALTELQRCASRRRHRRVTDRRVIVGTGGEGTDPSIATAHRAGTPRDRRPASESTNDDLLKLVERLANFGERRREIDQHLSDRLPLSGHFRAGVDQLANVRLAQGRHGVRPPQRLDLVD